MSDDHLEDGTPEQLLAVIEKIGGLPLADGPEWIDWEIDGHEGESGDILHFFGLAHHPDADRVAALTGPLADLADQRWGKRRHFDATAQYGDLDRRLAPATAIRAMRADGAAWWQVGDDTVLLVDNSGSAPERCIAGVLVMPVQFMDEPGAEEESLTSPLVADFLSGENDRIMHALWEVVATRDPEVLKPLVTALPAIRRSTSNADLGGAFIPNADNLEHAFARIEMFEEGTCLCAAYPLRSTYDPEREQARGHVRIDSEVVKHPQGRPERVCTCTDCGRQYDVEEGEYHYTWWKWVARQKG